jgi:hypothetical protein
MKITPIITNSTNSNYKQNQVVKKNKNNNSAFGAFVNVKTTKNFFESSDVIFTMDLMDDIMKAGSDVISHKREIGKKHLFDFEFEDKFNPKIKNLIKKWKTKYPQNKFELSDKNCITGESHPSADFTEFKNQDIILANLKIYPLE